MRKILFFVSMFILLVISGCNKQDEDFRMKPEEGGKNHYLPCDQGTVKIAVISDLHYMDPSLLKADGTAFQTYLMQDRKLLAESGAILQQVFLKLRIERPDLVLITGDLTKDGELVSHKWILKQLELLKINRIKVLVVPGNHDINNPDAKLFDGDNTSPVSTITPENFKTLYADFGYKNTISRDQNSLSYVSEPIKGLRILALDANEYYNNTPDYCVVAGNIKDETMVWAKAQLADAKAKGKTVIGMMHHGLVEHFMGESVLFKDYLVDNYISRSEELMQAGLKVIFTGHFHANDAIQTNSGNFILTDIETGSPVSYDSPYRIVNLTDNKLFVRTKNIERIFYPGLNGVPFHEYEKAFTLAGIELQAKYMLMNEPYNVPEENATMIAPVFAGAMLAHFGGDETISAEMDAQIQAIAAFSTDLANILYGLLTDLPPTDNNLTVDLK